MRCGRRQACAGHPVAAGCCRPPYTGAHSDAWLETLSKVATKLKLEQAGLPTPGFSVDGAGLDPERFIVKAVWEHGSLGSTKVRW